MNSFLNLSTNAIKTADSLIRHAKEETYDEVEDSIKSLRKNFKAGNYFAIATFFIIIGIITDLQYSRRNVCTSFPIFEISLGMQI